MKRRSFGLLAGTGLMALKIRPARAQTAPDPALLKTTLTPFGAERAGNAEGTIPAWTGGYTTIPAGWQPGQFMPSPFDNEPMLLTIDSANMAQHADRLSEGLMTMMRKYGYSINVFPTHRTAAAPQWVYDNIAANAVNAKPNPGGARLGFLGAFGGAPFPIPDTSDPLVAGAQIVWNHCTRWNGYGFAFDNWAFAVSEGHVALADLSPNQFDYPYYRRNGTLATYNGELNRSFTSYLAPANDVGELIDIIDFTNPYVTQDETWQLLNGQGRVRKSPEVAYDTPASQTDGLANYDEYYGFHGSLQKYDWKYLGKKEMYIPYHNNAMFGLPGEPVHLANFLDPKVVRWELHRVWVVEATLHPGERNVLLRRRLYIEEDTWTDALVDVYDGNNALFHTGISYFYLRPDLPGVIMGNNTCHNLQSDDYASMAGLWNEKTHPTLIFNNGYPDSLYDPQNMAAAAQY
jgi:hypothetical protein